MQERDLADRWRFGRTESVCRFAVRPLLLLALMAGAGLHAPSPARAQEPPDRVRVRLESAVERGLDMVVLDTEKRPGAAIDPLQLVHADGVLHRRYATRSAAAESVHARVLDWWEGRLERLEKGRSISGTSWTLVCRAVEATARRIRLRAAGGVPAEAGDPARDRDLIVRTVARIDAVRPGFRDGAAAGLWNGGYEQRLRLATPVLALDAASEAGIDVPSAPFEEALRIVVEAWENASGPRGWPDPAQEQKGATSQSLGGGVVVTALGLRHCPEGPLAKRGRNVLSTATTVLLESAETAACHGRRHGFHPTHSYGCLLATETALDRAGARVSGAGWRAEAVEHLLAFQSSDGTWLGDYAWIPRQAEALGVLLNVLEVAPPPTAFRNAAERAFAAVAREATRRWADFDGAHRPVAEQALFEMEVARYGPSILPALVGRLTDEEPAHRVAAATLLRGILDEKARATLPEALGSVAILGTEEGATAARLWRDWNARHGERLVRAEGRGRLRLLPSPR